MSTLLLSDYVSDGSAIFKGCFRRPDNVTLALPVGAAIKNMSVDNCVDVCTEKVCISEVTNVWSCRAILYEENLHFSSMSS